MTKHGLKLHEECGATAVFRNGTVQTSGEGVAITCFLPVGHKFVRHCARMGEEQIIVEWGVPQQKASPHVHGALPGACEVFGCADKITV